MDLKKTSELFALAIPPLIACSSLRLLTFYGHWHIPIFDYLSPSEILFSFLQPGLIMFGLFTLYILSNFALFMFGRWLQTILAKNNSWKKFANPNSEEPDLKKSSGPGDNNLSAFGLMLFMAIVGAISLYNSVWVDYSIFWVVSGHVLFWIISWTIIGLVLPSMNQDIVVLISIILTLLSGSFFYGRYQARSIIRDADHHILFLTTNVQ